MKNQIPVEVSGYDMMTNLSSTTEEEYNVMNHFTDSSITETSFNSLSSSEFMVGSMAASNLSRCPKGSPNDNDKKNYDAFVKSICDDHISELKDNEPFKHSCPRNFPDGLIKEKKDE